MYGVAGKKFQRQYKNRISDYKTWKEKSHAQEWLIYPENMSQSLSIDEVALSSGELYTVVTSKKAKGKKGCLVAIIKETRAETVIEHLLKIDRKLRLSVKEITLDMAGSMKLIAKRCFSNAKRTIDRFHVQQLASEALQEIRIKHRWKAIEQENDGFLNARKNKEIYQPELCSNGDTRKQLLARSRHLLYKSSFHWTESQKERAQILFSEYPDIQNAYQLTEDLRNVYHKKNTKEIAMLKLARWYHQVEVSGFKSFAILLKTFTIHYNDILNYFNHRSTNASAESFNAKIKKFRSNFRGVRDRAFFLFRLQNIFA